MTSTSRANDNNDSDDLNGQTFGNDSIEEEERVENDNNGEGKKKKNNCEKKDRRKEQKKKQNNTKALNALEVIRNKCLELFVDQIGEPYAAIKIRDHMETIPIRSNRFKDWIVKAYYDYRKEQQEKLLDEEEFDGKEEYNTIDDITSSSPPFLSNEDAAKIQTILKMEAEELHDVRKLEVRVAGNVDSDADANDDDNVIYLL